MGLVLPGWCTATAHKLEITCSRKRKSFQKKITGGGAKGGAGVGEEAHIFDVQARVAAIPVFLLECQKSGILFGSATKKKQTKTKQKLSRRQRRH